MISSRYAPIVALLLILALVPTIIHSYLQQKTDDEVIVSSTIPSIEGYTSEPFTRHNTEWVKTMFDSEDWFERIYRAADGKVIRLFVTRSYNHKRLYHHPELGLSHGSDLKREGVVMLKGERQIPVHLLRNNNGRGLVAYVLLSDGKYIDRPVVHQIQESLKQLVSASRPMTIFYVSDTSSPAGVDFNRTSAAVVLGAAIDRFNSDIEKQ